MVATHATSAKNVAVERVLASYDQDQKVSCTYRFHSSNQTRCACVTACPLCHGPTRAKMFGDVLAMENTCAGGDGCRCRTCGPTRKLTRDVLTNLRGSITDVSPNIRRCIGEDSGINCRYIG